MGAALAGLLAVGTVACASGGAAVSAATFTTIGSAEQVFVTDATPGHTLELRSSAGTVVATAKADSQGSKVFRKVPSGNGYRVRDTTGELAQSEPVTVRSTDPTPTSTKTYDQTLPTGFDAKGQAAEARWLRLPDRA